MRFDVKGLKELEKNLSLLSDPRKIKKNVKSSQREAAKLIQKSIKSEAPKISGQLIKSIKLKQGSSKGGIIDFYVRATAPHAHLVEFGTAPHLIVAEQGKSIRIRDNFIKVVNHPGSRANPFFTRGYEKSKNSFINNFSINIWNKTIESLRS